MLRGDDEVGTFTPTYSKLLPFTIREMGDYSARQADRRMSSVRLRRKTP
jgi:hypothetical protein